jgi:hypothetical protein
MEELITWASSLTEKDYFFAFMMFGVLSLVATFIGTLVKVHMDVSREQRDPHTMSEDAYVRQLESRTGVSRDRRSGNDCTGPR